MRQAIRPVIWILLLSSLIILGACVPEEGERLSLHDVAIYSNATDLRGLYGYLYGPTGSLGVGGRTVSLSNDPLTGELAVASALSVDGEPYLKQALPRLLPPPTRVQRVPLTSDVQLEIGDPVAEVLYFDGGRWFTLSGATAQNARRVVTPRLRAGGLQGVGQLNREEAESLQAALEPRAPVAVTVFPEEDIPFTPRAADGMEAYLRTALYVQQTAPTDVSAYQAPAEELIFERIAEGAQSAAEEQAFILVQDEAELLELWNVAYGAQLNVPPLPDVNFQREAVLAVFAGQKPTGGYGVELRGVELERDDVYVDLLLTEPAEGSMNTQALTSPWLMLRVLRADINAAWFRNPETGELYSVARATE